MVYTLYAKECANAGDRTVNKIVTGIRMFQNPETKRTIQSIWEVSSLSQDLDY